MAILTEHTCTHPNTHRIMASSREAGYSHSGGETLFIHLNHSMFVEHSHMVLDMEEDKVQDVNGEEEEIVLLGHVVNRKCHGTAPWRQTRWHGSRGTFLG